MPIRLLRQIAGRELPGHVGLALGLASILLYFFLFFPAYWGAGKVASSLVFVPLIVLGWLYGLRGSVLFAVTTPLLSIALYTWVGDVDGTSPTPLLIGSVACMVVGLVVGGMRDLLRYLSIQADDFAAQRATLEQEIARRQTAEDQLHKMNSQLELAVADRTAKLNDLNKQLEVELAERKSVEQQLVHNGLHDHLTGLPNRRLLLERLGHALTRAQRRLDYAYTVLYLDFDRFKVVNDSLGHAVGDLVLLEATRRLQASVRTTDTIARMGGDEFTILLDEIGRLEDAIMIADRTLEELARPYELQGRTVFMSASLGIVPNPKEYEDAEAILRDADTAMYCAKSLGRGRYVVFDSKMHAQARARHELESQLRQAIERSEFQVHYQPIVALPTERIIGFEALLRWEHPSQGLIPPSVFIPVAEETGLIIPIGRFVLRQACQQLAQWQQTFATNPPLTVAVNLSAKEFAQLDLLDQIKHVLAEAHLAPHSLLLEITESMILEDDQAIRGTLSQLRELGVRVEIDDFGTGYSSLGYLTRFPVDTIKIDRSFISRMGSKGDGSHITRSILSLAHELGLEVVAEGVETMAQVSQLKGWQCEYAQGYFFARAVDKNSASQMLAATGALVPASFQLAVVA